MGDFYFNLAKFTIMNINASNNYQAITFIEHLTGYKYSPQEYMQTSAMLDNLKGNYLDAYIKRTSEKDVTRTTPVINQ